MSCLAFFHILLSTALLIYSITLRDAEGTDLYRLFRDFVQKYNKTYQPGTPEYNKREAIFKQSLERIEWLNELRNDSDTLYGINQFSDLTPEEFQNYVRITHFKTKVKHKPRSKSKKRLLTASFVDSFPQKVDWRDRHVVTAVRNQDKCGACWAFSTVETIESMYALKYNVLEEWSIQQLIDCATKPNQGCEGGDTCLAIEWLYQNRVNLVLAEDYPFIDGSGLCKIKKSSKTVRVASNFTCDSFVGEEELMLYQLAFHGPLVAAVDASGWQDYLGGIIQYHCEDDRNHAVQIVGYDLTGDVPYYIVRNSWGTNFGNSGYLYISIGKNMCGIAEEVSALDVL